MWPAPAGNFVSNGALIDFAVCHMTVTQAMKVRDVI